MNFISNYCYKLLLIAGLSVFLLISCNKSDETSLAKGNIIINLQGVQDYVSFDKIAEVNKNTSSEKSQTVQSYDQFDAITTFSLHDSPNKPSNISGGINTSSIKGKDSQLAAVPISDNVKYRLLIYRGSQTVPEYNVVLAKGENPTFSLYIGQTYKWVAYSINDVAVVPDITNNVIDKTTIGNKDFMYATDNITIATGENYLNMIFRRMATLFEVTLNTRGMFGTIENTTNVKVYNGSSAVISRTADFNVLNGEFVAGTYQDVATDALSMTNVIADSIPTGMVKVGNIYSLGLTSSIAANSLNIGLEPLSIKLHENTVRTFASSKLSLSHGVVNIQPGRRYKINATLIESGIRVSAGGAQWARSNLWYDASASNENKYRFRASPHFRDLQNFRTMGSAVILGSFAINGYDKYYTDINDLWNYGAQTPSGTNVNIDPCSNVFPKGWWRMPTDANFQEILTRNPNNLFLVNRGDARIGYGVNLLVTTITVFNSERYELVAGWNRLDQTNAVDGYNANYASYTGVASGMNDLYLSGVGYRQSGSGDFEAISRPSVTNILDVGLLGSSLANLGLAGGLSGGGFYWTRDRLTSGNSYFNFAANNTSLVSLGLVDLLALRLLQSNSYTASAGQGLAAGSRLNIRCVRNPNF